MRKWILPLLLVSKSGFAQTLTLEDCIRMAQSAPSTVAAARMQSEIARQGSIQARANFLPQFSVEGAFAYNSPLHGQFSFIALNGIHEYTVLPTASLELDTAGRLRAIRARAEADKQAAAASLAVTERDLKRAVTASYYRLLLGRRMIKVSEDTLTEAQSFEKRTRLLFANGEAAQADVVKAAGEVAFLEQTLQAAQLEARLANHDLASFWTSDVEKALDIADVLDQAQPAPDQQSPAGQPFMGRPEFRLLDAQQLGFQADARRARADRLPQMNLMLQWGIDSTRFSFEDRGYAGFVRLNVPVFDWFRARSAQKQFQLQAQQTQVNRQISERAFSKEYRDALAKVEMIYAQIAKTEAQVKLSSENLRLSRVRYEGGEGSSLDVVASQNQLAQARANYYTVKANYLNARADLEVARGQ